MVWTHFWDMHSGGGQKLEYGHIYIEAPEKEAVVIFYNIFHRNPFRVTCTCCGPDYSVEEYKTLNAATAFERKSVIYSKKKLTLQEYKNAPGVYFVPAKDIDPKWKQGDVPKEGYVWV